MCEEIPAPRIDFHRFNMTIIFKLILFEEWLILWELGCDQALDGDCLKSLSFKIYNGWAIMLFTKFEVNYFLIFYLDLKYSLKATLWPLDC